MGYVKIIFKTVWWMSPFWSYLDLEFDSEPLTLSQDLPSCWQLPTQSQSVSWVSWTVSAGLPLIFLPAFFSFCAKITAKCKSSAALHRWYSNSIWGSVSLVGTMVIIQELEARTSVRRLQGVLIFLRCCVSDVINCQGAHICQQWSSTGPVRCYSRNSCVRDAFNSRVVGHCGR